MAVLEQIARAAEHLAGELSEMRGEHISCLPTALDQISDAVIHIKVEDTDITALAALMCLLMNDLDVSSPAPRPLRALAYFTCVREIRRRVTALNNSKFSLIRRTGQWNKLPRAVGTSVKHRFYFAWFYAAGAAYLMGLSPNIDRPIAGLLQIAIKPA